jgi:hypothetical protein
MPGFYGYTLTNVGASLLANTVFQPLVCRLTLLREQARSHQEMHLLLGIGFR